MSARRIALVADEASVHTAVWRSGLTARGHEVRLWSCRRAPVASGVAAASDSAAAPPPASGPRRPSRELRTITRALRLAPRFRREVRGFDPDLVLALRFQPEAYLAWLGGIGPLAVVSWGQDVLRFSVGHPFHRFFSRRVIADSARVWGETTSVLQGLCDLGADREKIGLAYTGVDLQFWQRPAEIEAQLASLAEQDAGWARLLHHRAAGGLSLLSPRAIDRSGHQAELLAAVAERPDLQFVLVGPGDAYERSRLHAFAVRNGMEGRFVDLGMRSPHELRLLYWIADLVASLWMPDGLSQTMLEAMAAGAKLLVADLPGNRDWIENDAAGARVDPTDLGAIGRAIDRLIRSDGGTLHATRVAERADRRIALTRWVDEVERLW
ncbi:MAG: glycosyltransferase family 4 protein [Candidatus Eisenbacteria bacterium]|nr:glycosyltransferase family 4 protein [Candidatus Eisenbacteria bacterium]